MRMIWLRCLFFSVMPQPPTSTLFPYTTLFRSSPQEQTVREPVAHLLAKRWLATRQKRSEEHTSELQSRLHLVCRLLLEKITRTARHLHQFHCELVPDLRVVRVMHYRHPQAVDL